MRLLVTVTVLYLVTSSVYSVSPPYPKVHCICPLIRCLEEYCPRPGFCKGGTVKDCGCCEVCAKVEGERCECDEQCDRGLKCTSWHPLGITTCQPGGNNQQKKSCYHNGKEIKHGQDYIHDCMHCFCRDGDFACRPDPGLCDEKKSCNHNGHQFPHGQSYTYRDGCRVCVCNDGVSKCHVNKQCRYGKKSCYHNGQEFLHGQRFMIECNHCTCSNGRAACTKIGCDVPMPKYW